MLTIPQGGSPADWDEMERGDVDLFWEMHTAFKEAEAKVYQEKGKRAAMRTGPRSRRRR